MPIATFDLLMPHNRNQILRPDKWLRIIELYLIDAKSSKASREVEVTQTHNPGTFAVTSFTAESVDINGKEPPFGRVYKHMALARLKAMTSIPFVE